MSTHTPRNVSPATAGLIVHRAIADLLEQTRTPSAFLMREAIKTRTQAIGDRSHTRAVRQRAFAFTCLYFWHFALDDSWGFAGAEVDLGAGHVDLMFRRDGWVLIDEVKTGIDARLALGMTTQRQTDRYVVDARKVHGDRLLGVRVLALGDPARSLLKTDLGVTQLLLETPYYPGRNN